MKRFYFLWVLAATIFSISFCSYADSCKVQGGKKPLNLTIPLTVQIPEAADSAQIGSVLYLNERTLSQMTSVHRNITTMCLDAIQHILTGRINSAQVGNNIFTTPLPGVGLRLTIIYDKSGMAHKEWILPFTASIKDSSKGPISTDDIKLRIEIIKTGIIKGGSVNIQIPSLLSFGDNSLVVSLAVRLLSVKAHCEFVVNQPQIDLPPIDINELSAKVNAKHYPIDVKLRCINTSHVGINIEGATELHSTSTFKNVASDNPASGVGMQILYDGIVIAPFHPINLLLPLQKIDISIPLSVRYAKSSQPLSVGKVKAEITLRVDYL